ELITIEWSDMRWARPYINVNARGKQPRTPSDIVQVGDLVRIEPIGQDRWALGQVPSIQGAFIATDPQNGAIRAMVGGYDFRLNQFNHVTQAKRQPGSNFKPFFYAGAMESGLTAATIYNDAPVVLPGGELEETYRPRNSGNSFRGNIRVREALFRSINLVSLRIILDYGPEKIVDYVRRFGFDTTDFPRNVQLAFGGGTIALTPEEVVTGYSILANGGAAVKAHLISSIQSIRNEQIFSAEPKKRCPHPCDYSNPAEQVVEPRVAFIMNNILADTIRKGTGRQVFRELKRSDIMGKTGTTNDADVWFSGYTRNLAATAWAGFSNNSPVGNREWGSTTPIAIWIDFAKQALPSPSASVLQVPDGIVSVRIDPDSGLRTSSTDPDGIFEFFRAEFLPEQQPVKPVKDEKSPYQQIF
ncbi:MAG: penicillin-binding transpeptidase domain-containing protein, partial [Pseudomonadota bacterium]|nr:penicillin-binding transpeptidase domain-containing protein [Pseudomonadota bacterium]